ncbi:hypothetical protein FRC00_010596 [Tulasnella sp. 408]|nr:hypothetical protein FRC00_010596 [Tulasnella sp. 408]
MFESFTQPKTEQSALLSVARTCQAFTEVALDILYCNIRFQDLLQVWHARGILKRVNKPFTKSQEIVFDRVPDPSEYQRLSYYSRRVRILEFRYEWWTVPQYSYCGYDTNFFPTFIEMIVDRGTKRAELFPQLHSLTWSGPGEIELVGCEAIIQASPQLKAFAYAEYRDDPQSSAESWPTLIRTLASAQSLEKIRISLDLPVIDSIGPGTRAGLALSGLIMKPNLKELELPDYVIESTVVMSSFAFACQLEKLVLSPAWKSVTGKAKVPRTASLDRLSYLSGTLEGMTSILAMPFVFRALSTLTTDDILETSFTWSYVRTFFQLVGNVCPVVETLHLSGHMNRCPIDQRTGFVLAPLKACTLIQSFKLHVMDLDGPIASVPQDFNPTDLDWRYLITEWPDLQQMSYHFSGPPEGGEYYRRLVPRPQATVKTLTEFSRVCRQLRTLTVPITLTSYDADAALQDDILPFNNSMYSINFFNYSIEDDAAEEAAILLLRLTRDDVEFHWETWVYPDDVEEEGFDMRNERNGCAVKKHIDFTRKARPTGPTPASSGSRDLAETWFDIA